jgi:hypothetical protein
VVEGKSKECDAKRDEKKIGAVMEKAWENYTVDGARHILIVDKCVLDN